MRVAQYLVEGDGRRVKTTIEGQVSRRRLIAGGPLALAATTALAACGSNPRPEVGARRPPQRPVVEPELAFLRDGTSEVTVAGERLNVGQLRRFYERSGYERVWASRPAQAEALANAVMRAGDHGLDPELFYGGLLLRRASFPPRHRELLLTHAALAYADALAHGAVDVDRRREGQVLAPDPTDVVATLYAAKDRADPAAAIEALAPATPTYRALRQALRGQRGGGPVSLVGGRAGAARLRTIEANLERQRWLPRQLPPDRVWVNVADQKLVLFRGDRPVFATRVVVGEESERSQSPEFRATIEASFYNPPWIIPEDIVTAEILPRIQRDPTYLTRHNMVMRHNGEIEQLPGPQAGLGAIMFDMPNRFDVYLHDTPEKQLFLRPNRRISHGCIRVQNPREFAALLMQQPLDTINQGIATGATIRVNLPTPVPVFVVYQTAFAETDGPVQFRPDFYNRDNDVWMRLQSGSDEPLPPVQATPRPAVPARPAPPLRRRA